MTFWILLYRLCRVGLHVGHAVFHTDGCSGSLMLSFKSLYIRKGEDTGQAQGTTIEEARIYVPPGQSDDVRSFPWGRAAADTRFHPSQADEYRSGSHPRHVAEFLAARLRWRRLFSYLPPGD